MKKIPIFWNGKLLRDVYPHATKWQVFKYRVKKFLMGCLFWLTVIAISFGIFMAGRYLYPTQVYTKQEVIKEVEVKAPVLDRIALCESKGNHWATNGQVKVAGNKNGSVDIGKYQINNNIWGAKATEMGLNLMVEKDNEEFARYLYKNYGTEPWVWTKSCWNK